MCQNNLERVYISSANLNVKAVSFVLVKLVNAHAQGYVHVSYTIDLSWLS